MFHVDWRSYAKDSRPSHLARCGGLTLLAECSRSAHTTVLKESAHHLAGALAGQAIAVPLYPAPFRLAGRAITVLADLAGHVEQTSAAPDLAIAAVEAAAVQIVATVCAVQFRNVVHVSLPHAAFAARSFCAQC